MGAGQHCGRSVDEASTPGGRRRRPRRDGSTIAAAEHCGYASIGLEIDPAYFDVAVRAVPRLARDTPGS